MNEDFHLILKVVANQGVVEIVADTAGSVLIKIDPSLPWNRDALLMLTAALEAVAKRLPQARHETDT